MDENIVTKQGSRKGMELEYSCIKVRIGRESKQECKGHLWLKGKVAREQTLVGFVYLWRQMPDENKKNGRMHSK